MVRNSIEAYTKGDFQAAFESIKGVPDTLGEPRFFAYRASLLLAVGRFDEANRDIERALSLNPNYSEALSLQAIIVVAQNDKEKARDLAQRAVTADPKSATALVALSFERRRLAQWNGGWRVVRVKALARHGRRVQVQQRPRTQGQPP